MTRWCALGILVAAPALAGPPLEVHQQTGGIGDGRTLVGFTVRGGPPRVPIEPADHPELPHVRCEGVAVFPAHASDGFEILPPALTEVRVVPCLVEQRGARATFDLRVRPTGPGLYAELRPAHAATGDPPIEGVAFVVDADGVRQRPAALQVAVSVGTVEVDGDRFTITLPAERAPKLVAIALADGERVGAAFIPVRGRVELPVSTLAGAEVRVRVAGDWFGPVRAKRGTVTVPLEVPPGVHEAVVRAADAVGNVGDTVVDLNTPERPRLAFVAPGREVSAGSSMLLAVVYARPDGRPGDADTPLVVEAERGRVGAPEFRGGGLWAVPYTTLAELGEDRLVVRIDGDDAAGAVDLAIRFVPGRPARVELRVPEEPHAAGAVVDAEVRVLDWIGLPLSAATATVTVDGEPAVVERVSGMLRARLPMPEVVPASGRVRVDVEAESAHLERMVAVSPAAVARAELAVESRGRTAAVRVVAADRFGNRVSRAGFEVETEGGRTRDGRETAAGWEAELVAEEDAWSARLRVVAGAGPLAEGLVEFSPPTRAFRVGAVASAGVTSSGFGVAAPRGGLAAVLRRGFGTFELALQVGVDVSGHSAESTLRVDDATYPLSRALTTVGVPVRVSGRRWLSSRFGLAGGLSVVPMYVRVSLDPEFQEAEVGEDWVVGVRADLRGFVALGPGEVFAEVGVSSAQLDHRLAAGTLERFVANVGYTFWVPGLAF